jgi:hypothetical protein
MSRVGMSISSRKSLSLSDFFFECDSFLFTTRSRELTREHEVHEGSSIRSANQ